MKVIQTQQPEYKCSDGMIHHDVYLAMKHERVLKMTKLVQQSLGENWSSRNCYEVANMLYENWSVLHSTWREKVKIIIE